MRYAKFLFLIIAIGLIAGTAAVLVAKHSSDRNRSTSTTPTSSNLSPSSGVTDTNGQHTTSSGSPVRSASGIITLEQPTADAKLSTGTMVSGEATVDQVQYRIKDNVKGVIGQGTLNVVYGKFSGTLTIHAYGSSGTFEVYSYNSSTGAEENNLKINVTF